MIDTVPTEWWSLVKDKEAFLNEIDPDWKSRFPDQDMAIDFYRVMDPKTFLNALKASQ